MYVIYGLFYIITGVLIGVVTLIITYIFLRIFMTFVSSIRGSGKFKDRFREKLLYTPYGKLFDFAKWSIYDLAAGKDKVKLFGVWAFTGYYGQGKTMGAVTFANYLKNKYPEKNISIYSNFDLKGQDGRVEKWEDLLELPPNTILVFDEIQSTFSSQKFKDFPLDLLWKLTQCRKHGLMILASTPVYSRMVIQFRESVDYVVVCRNTFGLDRFFRYSFFHAPEYEKYREDKFKLLRHRAFNFSFIATNKHYQQYNTQEQVDRMDIVGNDEKKAVRDPAIKKQIDFLRKEIEQLKKKSA